MASVGETLRSAREQRGLSIEQVSHDTRISPRFLEALEADRFDALPAPVYVRGFIRSYASYLKLDGNELISRLAETGAAPIGVGARDPGGVRPDAPRADPFRRDQRTEPFNNAQVVPTPTPQPSAREWEPEMDAAQTIRRRPAAPGRPLPPPVIPPDAYEPDEIDEDGYLSRHPTAVLAETEGGRSPSRAIAFAGIGLLGIAIAVVTGVMLTRGDDDPVATAITDESPTRSSGTVVAIGTQNPGAGATGTAAPSPSVTPSESASPSPTADDEEAPPAGEPTATPESEPTDEDTPEPTSAATSVPTAVPTPTPIPATAIPTPIPTFTPTQAVVQPHPFQFSECTVAGATPCGEPPLRVICPPDGTWFVDVNKDYPNPGWPENTSAITTSQAAAIGEARCP